MRWRDVATLTVVAWLLVATVAAQGPVTVQVGDIQAPHGEDVEIPIEVTGASGVGAMHIEMTYDPAVLTVKEVQSGDLLGGGQVAGNTATAGRVTISAIHPGGFSGDGIVAKVVARVGGKDGATCPLSLQNVTANHFQTKAAIPTTVLDGSFTEGGSMVGSAGVWVLGGLIALLLGGAALYAFTRRTAARAKPVQPAAGRSGAVGLFVTGGAASQSFLPLDQPVTTIGRSSGNRLVLDDDQVSREHARIVTQGDIHTIYDLGSANGVFVNGVQVGQQALRVGDEIRLGSTRLTVRQL